MKKILSVSVVLLLTFCSGCGKGYREIERGYLVTAVGLCVNESKVQIVLETLSASDTDSGSESIKLLYGDGNSLREAYDNIKKSLIKTLYFEHCGVIAADNSLANNEMYKLLDFCNNIETLKSDVYLVQTDNADELLQTEAVYKSVGYGIIELIKNSGNYSDGDIRLYGIKRHRKNGTAVKLPLVNVKNNTLVLE